mmetsp:Transcript_67380/g.152484  ORF Transcript_67380/g.152484 Transcript_67380/m.152484 type:complete len:80 (-) Transcript_67380:102-341(-)
MKHRASDLNQPTPPLSPLHHPPPPPTTCQVAQLVQCAAECFLGGPNQPANSDPELPGLFKTFLPDQAKHLLDKLLEAKR